MLNALLKSSYHNPVSSSNGSVPIFPLNLTYLFSVCGYYSLKIYFKIDLFKTFIRLTSIHDFVHCYLNLVVVFDP